MDPTFVPPPSVSAGNFKNPSTLAPLVVATSGALCSLAIVAAILRVWTRIHYHKRISLGDVLVVVATFLNTMMGFCYIHATRFGLGRYWRDIPPEWYIPGLDKFPQALYLSSLFYLATLTFIKLSILIFYTQLISCLRFLRACYISMFVICGLGIATIFSVIFACNPIWASWNFSDALLTDIKCVSIYAIYMSAAVLHSATDLFLLFMPLKGILMMQMDLRRKISLFTAYVLAVLAIAGGIARIAFYKQQGRDKLEYNYYCAKSAMAGVAHTSFGIIVCCLPSIHALLTRNFPNVFPPLALPPPPSADQDSEQVGVLSTSAKSDVEAPTRSQSSKKGKSRSSESSLPPAIITTRIYDARTEQNVYKASVKGARESGYSRRRNGSWCFSCDTESLEMIESNDGTAQPFETPGVIERTVDFSIKFEDLSVPVPKR